MEITLYIYFGINLFIAGMYFGDVSFNLYSKKEIIIWTSFLIFFGGILLLWEATIAQKFDNWFNSSEFGFWWKMNVNKKYDNLKPEQVEYIEGQIRREKGLNRKDSNKLIEHLTKILKRNNVKI